jgi:hypothetical protein
MPRRASLSKGAVFPEIVLSDLHGPSERARTTTYGKQGQRPGGLYGHIRAHKGGVHNRRSDLSGTVTADGLSARVHLFCAAVDRYQAGAESGSYFPLDGWMLAEAVYTAMRSLEPPQAQGASRSKRGVPNDAQSDAGRFYGNRT